MAQTYPLDTVIQVVTADFRVTSPDQHVVVIDAESRRAVGIIDVHGKTSLAKSGIFGRLKVRKYFLVSNNSDRRNEAEGQAPPFPLRDFAHKWTLNLRPSYLVSCSPGNEAQVAQALCNGSHPGAVLNESITKWLKDFAAAQPADLIENFYSRKSELETHVAVRAMAEAGLNLQVILRLESESEAFKPIKIPARHFPVRFKDYDKEQDLKLEAEVQIDPERKIYAVLHHHQIHRIADLISTTTREYFAARVTLHQFHSALSAPTLKAELTTHLNSTLRPFGRQIAFISLENKNGDLPTRTANAFFEAKENVEFDEIQEYDKPVLVKNTVQMSLQDYALFKNGGVEDLNKWLKDNLREIIRQVLFGKRYIDLLIGFAPLEKEIKETLSLRAEAIGYSIKQLITVPDLKPYEWLENIPLEISREYETSIPKFPVNLAVVVTARIRRLEDIESYLNRRQDVPQLMEQAIVQETRQILHGIDPERFYMRFTYSETEEMAVEEALKQSIQKRLEDQFKADIISIVLKMLDTEITEIWSRLEKSEGSLEIQLPSFSDIEGVTYRGRIRVEAIHAKGWNRFRTANPDIERLCRRLEEHVLARLGTFAGADLVYTNLEGQLEVERVIEDLIKRFAVEEFGLVIRVNSIRRDVTLIESNVKELIQGKLAALKELEHQRIVEIKNGGTAERIKAIEDRMTKLESELPSNVKTTRMKFTRPELIEPAAPTRVTGLIVSRKSISAGGRPRNPSQGEEPE
jgi:hypothetical protein